VITVKTNTRATLYRVLSAVHQPTGSTDPTRPSSRSPQPTRPSTRGKLTQTNGKVERFNRTLLDEWAYVRTYRSDNARNQALDRWLHTYNPHRAHTALGGQPPMSRLNNLPGQYT
jgi:transposase InsO family protein